jgi:hypothetical protein
VPEQPKIVPGPTPEQEEKLKDAIRQSIGEDAQGRDDLGNSTLIPKSGGGGASILLLPLEMVAPVLDALLGGNNYRPDPGVPQGSA